MRWIPDTTRRFVQRPVYEESEIENEAESAYREYTQHTTPKSRFPVGDDDLVGLAESLTDNVDFDALLQKGEDGYTTFARGRARMFINRDLASASMLNRRRFTIAHEVGHIVLHRGLFAHNASQISFLSDNELSVICKRVRIEHPSGDWIEWQAHYFASCLLMPASSVIETARTFAGRRIELPAPFDSQQASQIAQDVSRAFQVSTSAAEVRLKQLGVIGDQQNALHLTL